MVDSSNRPSITAVLNHVKKWAPCNNLRFNTDQTRELISTKTGKAIPPHTPDIIRVASLNILGVTISKEDLQATNHVYNLLSVCSRSLFGVHVFKTHGLTGAALHTVTKVSTIARLMYDVTAESVRASIERPYQRLQRMGYLHRNASDTLTLVERADGSLFRSIQQNPGHVLHLLLPTMQQHYSLLVWYDTGVSYKRTYYYYTTTVPSSYRPHNYVLTRRTTETVYLAKCIS